MMKAPLARLSPKILADLKTVGEEACRQGFQAYLVGGVVRDLLLKRANFDLDVVVEGDGLLVARALALHHKGELTMYPQFGTATLEFMNGIVIDFATARKETYSHPGALPTVKAGTLKEDLYRRDFTMNALAVSLDPSSLGEVVDVYQGLEDIKAKEIRILHSLSFVDDPTRILRCVRFSARLNFTIEPETLRLLKSALVKQSYKAVKPPRYFAEFRKILDEHSPLAVLKILDDLNGLDFISPRYRLDQARLACIENQVKRLRRDRFYQAKDFGWLYCLGVLASVEEQARNEFAQTCHFTKEERLSVLELSRVEELKKSLAVKNLAASQIYEILDPVDLEIIYFILASTSVNIVRRRVDQFLKVLRNVELKIDGSDLKKLGVAPGRFMGVVLHTLRLHKMDGKVKTHRDELVLAKQLMAKGLRME